MFGIYYYYRNLILLAVVPAIILLVKVYQKDKVEKESPKMLVTLIMCGIFSENSLVYHLITCMIIVAYAEEGSKYIMLKLRTWKSIEFNCLYDGMLYAVYISLGFAVLENISYSIGYGWGTALIRAVTAVPGHACFGVFMGAFYGFAKQYERIGRIDLSRRYRKFAVVVSAFIHGCYDLILTVELPTIAFYTYTIAMFVLAFRLLRKMSDMDRYI